TSVAVRVCPSAHTGRLWLTSVAVHVCPCVSVSTHRTSVAVHQYTYQHVGHPWVSVSTHMTSVCVRQHTQDVCGCPCVSVSTHRSSVAVHQYTYQHVGPWTQHADPSRGLMLLLPVDCSGDFGPRGLSVQYTQDICGCPSAHTGRPWVSIRTYRTSVAVHVCLCVSVSTHRTSVAVHQYTYQHVGPWTQHAGSSCGLFGCFWPTWAVCSVHTGRLWVSASTHRTSVDVHGCLQHTHDVCVCPTAHTRRPWLSVCARQHTQDVCGCPSVH
ncbi:unnamed protein product, partial [Brassica rapa]